MSDTESELELELWTDPCTEWNRQAALAVRSLYSLPCTPEQVEAMFDILVIATITMDLHLEEYDDWIQKGLDADAKRLQRKRRLLSMMPGSRVAKDLVEVELTCTRFLQNTYPDFKLWDNKSRYGFLRFFEVAFHLPRGTKHLVLAAKREQIAANPHPWTW